MKINVKPILYLPLIFFFLPAFAFYIPGIDGVYLFFYISLYLSFVVFLLKDKVKFINTIIDIIKKTPLKYLILTFVLIIINTLFLSLISICSFGASVKNIILRLLLAIIPVILFYCYTLCKYISIKKFIKVFLLLFWISLIIGFVAYIGQFFKIEFINNIFDFFANQRILAEKYGDISFGTLSNYEDFGMPRLDNLHQEPSHYAQFLFLFLPFVYSFGSSKLKIFKNIFFNALIKKTLIPFTWISLILTFSPIFLLFGFLITIIYYHEKILYIIKRYYICLLVLIFTILFLTYKIDLSETYLSRIINVLTNINTFDDFILVEPSLATRIVSYINCFCLFLKNFFTGIGIGNIANLIDEQYLTSPVSLTPEIISKNSMLIKTSKGFFTTGFIYAYLAENGIVITTVLIMFYYKLLKKINYFINQYKKRLLFEESYLKFMKHTFIALLINSFYNLSLSSIYLFFIISLIISHTYIYENKRITKGEHNEKNYMHG